MWQNHSWNILIPWMQLLRDNVFRTPIYIVIGGSSILEKQSSIGLKKTKTSQLSTLKKRGTLYVIARDFVWQNGCIMWRAEWVIWHDCNHSHYTLCNIWAEQSWFLYWTGNVKDLYIFCIFTGKWIKNEKQRKKFSFPHS